MNNTKPVEYEILSIDELDIAVNEFRNQFLNEVLTKGMPSDLHGAICNYGYAQYIRGMKSFKSKELV